MAEEQKEALAEKKGEEQKSAGPAVNAAPPTLRKIMGKKVGMTQIFNDAGMVVPVTVLEMGPNPILRVKTKETDGYSAVQVAYGPRKDKNMTKPALGQFKKAGQPPMQWVREFRTDGLQGFEAGQVITLADRFAPGDYVDVQAKSKGIGFAGVMKRHNFGGLPGSHGASDKERSPGSISSRRSLGRVMPGQRMAGHKGHVKTTSVKLEVVQVDVENNKLLVKGPVPGAANDGLVIVKETTRPLKKKVVHEKPTKKKKGKK